MRIKEILAEQDSGQDIETSLLGVLQFLRSRGREYDEAATINTDSLINMVRKTGVPFDYETLISVNDSVPAVKNLIASLSKDEVKLKPFAGETGAEPEAAAAPNINPEKKIDTMAKRALANRQ